ncbi:hypothetical protein WwSim0249 [Wolbachia endosymbiont of Drosophila simulans]|nr:hypothetical protein WwSim0249 [Wolbachia endosymbiont of Drosophila simulans]
MISSPEISALISGISFSACTAAFIKNDIKPSFIPYFFSKASLYFVLRSMTFFMSISLNVVSIAAVFCDAFKRAAITCLILLIFTRSSLCSPFTTLFGNSYCFIAGCSALFIWPITSAFVILPPMPVPLTLSALIAFSSIILRADGASFLAALSLLSSFFASSFTSPTESFANN